MARYSAVKLDRFFPLNFSICRRAAAERIFAVRFPEQEALGSIRDASIQRRFGGAIMSILAWIVLGLVAGFIASKVVTRSGGSLVLDLLLGVVGAFVGGFLFTRFGAAGVTGFNIYSILVATIGAVVVLFIYHAIAGRRAL
jgi:uncharacterized membrane protein YeaQ/YmgE (transglycosylase-associated protein family)